MDKYEKAVIDAARRFGTTRCSNGPEKVCPHCAAQRELDKAIYRLTAKRKGKRAKL